MKRIKKKPVNLKPVLAILVWLFLSINTTFAQENLKIMTFNVRYDESLFHKGEPRPTHWANRKLLQVELINVNQPDVIGMQEPHLHQVKYLDEQLPDYGWHGVGRADGKEKDEFNPIFYKKDKLNLVESGTFWLSETPDKPSRSWDAGYDRICTWVLFQHKKTKEQFYVFNTHFDSKGKNARVNSAKLLNEKINKMAGDKSVFVTGDFNFQPASAPYAETISQNLSDSRKIVESEPTGSEGTMNGFRYGATFKRRIDFIFVNQKVKVKKYEVINYSKDEIYPSDHFPVIIKAITSE